jgi:hypothetical protein
MSTEYWKWDSDPNVYQKKCNQCGQMLSSGPDSAVLYQGKSYHAHCLLDFLTAYHTNHESQIETKTGSDCGQVGWWGGVP